MEKFEVEQLSDKDLLEEWEQIKAGLRLHIGNQLPARTFNVFFADFVNVSNEMQKRKLKDDDIFK